jgi:nitrogenase subunit NifH
MCGKELNLKYILSILNSKLGKRMVKYYVVQLQNRQFRMLHQYVQNFPIPKSNDEKMTTYKKLADRILNLKENNLDHTNEENNLDSLIYNLFSLSKEEIEFIES